jgi:hypothetical protein
MLPTISLVPLLILVAVGILKGYDQLMNLVLDNVEEHLRGTPQCRGFS